MTLAERHFLELALRSPTGNPWPLIGIRQRIGGGKARMFERMKARGWFDASNRITEAGRTALNPTQDPNSVSGGGNG